MPKLRSFLVGLVLATSACATTDKVLSNDVDEVFHTQHTPREVVACFKQLNRTRVIERPDGARVAVFRNGYGGVVKTFSILPEGTGTKIESRHSALVVPGIKWQRCVGLKPMPEKVLSSVAEHGA